MKTYYHSFLFLLFLLFYGCSTAPVPLQRADFFSPYPDKSFRFSDNSYYSLRNKKSVEYQLELLKRLEPILREQSYLVSEIEELLAHNTKDQNGSSIQERDSQQNEKFSTIPREWEKKINKLLVEFNSVNTRLKNIQQNIHKRSLYVSQLSPQTSLQQSSTFISDSIKSDEKSIGY